MAQNQCVNPHEVEEGDLITYLHGEASPQVAAHIAHCPFCSEQVEQLRMVDVHWLPFTANPALPRRSWPISPSTGCHLPKNYVWRPTSGIVHTARKKSRPCAT